MYHLNDIKRYERCQRLFYYYQKNPKAKIEYINVHEDLRQYMINKLNFSDYFIGEANQSVETTLQAMHQFDELVSARFEAMGLRVKVSAMKKGTKGWILYFLSTTLYPKMNDAQKVVDTLWVLEQCKVKVEDVYFVHLHPQYVRLKTIDEQQLLVVDQQIYNDKKPIQKSLKEIVKKRHSEVKEAMEQMNALLYFEQLPFVPLSKCPLKKECPYFEECFSLKLPRNSILHLLGNKAKYTLFEAGMETIDQIDVNLITTPAQYAQYQAAKQGEFVDQVALHSWMSNISYPIAYLDFEWETYAIPPFEGMKPFDVLCFQYSLHVEQADGQVTHFNFLQQGDVRIAFIEALLRDVPPSGSIVVFNAQGGERLRLKQMAQNYPQYEDALTKIMERIVDLADLFTHGSLYDPAMEGAYNLKAITKAYTAYNYDELSIAHGMSAALSFRHIETLEEAQKKEVIEALLAYCAMDTLALYEIVKALKTKMME